MFKKCLLLIFILSLTVFFRAYNYENFYGFGHDQDLFAWIAKDQVVDNHIRLIGQETSIGGVFIGPLFYDLVTGAMYLFNMDPRSANIVTILISVFTAFSFYFVIKKFFNKEAGFFAAFLYATSLGAAFFDRWVVPTQPTLLWSIWYLYALLSVLSGNFKVLPLIALLVGLIWHVHIAFVPLLLIFPVAFWLHKKRNPNKQLNLNIKKKDLFLSLVIVLVLISPLIAFEARHNFQQVKGFLMSFSEERGDVKGIERGIKVIFSASTSLSLAILYGTTRLTTFNEVFLIPCLALFSAFFLIVKKILNRPQTLILGSWIGIVLLGQFISKRQISEYYFENLTVILFLVFGLLISYLYSLPKAKIPIALLLGFYLFFNTKTLLALPPANDNYASRRKIVEMIKKDVEANGYPCIGITYISEPGDKVGFRYLFWFYGLKTIRPSKDVPIYNIAIPWTHANPDELSYKAGYFGVILPQKTAIKDKGICDNPDSQFLPLSGFVN